LGRAVILEPYRQAGCHTLRSRGRYVRAASYGWSVLRRLRRLSEAECYVRLYGRDEDSVRVLRMEPSRPTGSAELSGEALRRLFEERLDAREREAA
jgi:hypothetical protein